MKVRATIALFSVLQAPAVRQTATQAPYIIFVHFMSDYAFAFFRRGPPARPTPLPAITAHFCLPMVARSLPQLVHAGEISCFSHRAVGMLARRAAWRTGPTGSENVPCLYRR